MTTDAALTMRAEKSTAKDAVDAAVVRIPRGSTDVPLLLVALALTGLGVVMIYSASSIVAEHRYGDRNYFLHRQLIGVAIGLVVMIVALRVDYRWYRRLVYPALAIGFGLLLAVFIPGIGTEAGGARRWIMLASVRFQPAEFVKIAAIVYLAYSVSKKNDRMRYFSIAFIPHLLVVGGFVVLLLPQPDFGTCAILMVMLGIMVFMGGARVSYLIALVLAVGIVAFDAITSSPYRLRRIEVFLNPQADPLGSGWQITESIIALGSGGEVGMGLGQGHFKLGFVPELWNDFIGAIIGHELGFVGIGAVVALFLLILWRGIHIALNASEPFGSFLAMGLTVLICLQAATNLGVVTGLLPTKGLTLPLVSYGRSSIIMILFSIGVLLNIAQNNPDVWQLERERREEERYHRELRQRKTRFLESNRPKRSASDGK